MTLNAVECERKGVQPGGTLNGGGFPDTDVLLREFEAATGDQERIPAPHRPGTDRRVTVGREDNPEEL
eukprot:CAMPEP_0194396318 /NCGR_PEP_ID=MMETSP0174-20130528/124919_1 /TAXON_ID=216777 /ORGANISM="Proboscia alata, Strain PI-D3" /LENGTH=67 /DNA_ID=CAMNT_0039192365 /DNA_START=121 /DNA_END=325 /DNA_ORIENTATION=+